jgi:hypothetical protein
MYSFPLTHAATKDTAWMTPTSEWVSLLFEETQVCPPVNVPGNNMCAQQISHYKLHLVGIRIRGSYGRRGSLNSFLAARSSGIRKTTVTISSLKYF